MTKLFVLDTSALISDPYCLDSFANQHVVIHASVLNELDKLKTFSNNAGKNARIIIRLLDEISTLGNIKEGVKTEKQTFLQIDVNNYNTSEFGDPTYTDNKILACAKKLNETYNVTVVSGDINMRIRAKAFGINAKNYEKENNSIKDLYDGAKIIHSSDISKKLKKSKIIPCSLHPELENMFPNEFVFLKDENGEGTILGRKIENEIKTLNTKKPWGLDSKNIEQTYSIDLLLDPKVPLVTLSGKAGTGKTLIAVACGMESVITMKQYNNLIIYRPIQPVGTDMGYLPGELSEKLEPWMSAIHDSIDYLTIRSKKHRKNNYKSWQDTHPQISDKIHLEALTYIRGRSIANSFIIMDETQNISKEEIKTILTRVGFNSKIVLTGDIEQIDNHNLDAMNNGLTYVINKFKESPLAGHVTLTQGERSPLASYAADIL